MFKNHLQELAQRSCFNLPSYACIREGPDHAPRFKASVNFNGEIFESPSYCPTLRQAEHAAAEVALNLLSSRGPSRSLTARVLDETGIYKNLLQETAHRAGVNLPVYTTVRSGPGHVPIFTCTVELAGMNFRGEPARTKKQAEKNAAIAAWSALKRMPNFDSMTNKEVDIREEQDQAVVARVLSNFRSKDEYRQARRKDQNQARRRIVRGPRDNTSASSSFTLNDSLKYPHWRLLDLTLDSALDGPTKKQNSFVSLLPPPPPRTTSMARTSSRESSTYPSNRPVPIQARGKSPAKMLEIPIPLDKRQKDDEESLSAKLEVTKKPIEKGATSNLNSSSVYVSNYIYRPFPFSNAGKHGSSSVDNTPHQKSTHISSSIFGSLNPSPIASTSIKPSSSTHIARTTCTRGFIPHRIAPAVQIRSVIPVCAAPPSPIRPPQPSTLFSASFPSTPSKSTQAGGAATAEVSALNKTQDSNPTQLISSSEFNNKLQL